MYFLPLISYVYLSLIHKFKYPNSNHGIKDQKKVMQTIQSEATVLLRKVIFLKEIVIVVTKLFC